MIYNNIRDATMYNIEEEKWEIMPSMIQPNDRGFHDDFIEGKFMVLGGVKFNKSGEMLRILVLVTCTCSLKGSDEILYIILANETGSPTSHYSICNIIVNKT